MRILPKISGRQPSSRVSTKDAKLNGEDEQRRSWHVGATHNHHHLHDHSSSSNSSNNIRSNSSSRRPRHKTWHFPRMSRHSNHDYDNNNGIFEDEFDLELNERRKTFSYAAHAGDPHRTTATETTTTTVTSVCSSTDEAANSRAPNRPPDSTDTDYYGKKDSWIKKLKRKTCRLFKSVEDFLFPGCHYVLHHHTTDGSSQQQLLHLHAMNVRGGVLLRCCLTADEHKAKIQETVELARHLYGARGLRAVGFEYRMVACPDHGAPPPNNKSTDSNDIVIIVDAVTGEESESLNGNLTYINNNNNINSGLTTILEKQNGAGSTSDDIIDIPPGVIITDAGGGDGEAAATNCFVDLEGIRRCEDNANTDSPQQTCHFCSTRLFHIESNTQIDAENRKHFIADGDMYDAVAQLCQENAHEIMQQNHNLRWVTVCSPDDDDDDPHPLKRNKDEPIRALVNAEHPLLALQENPASISKDQLNHFSRRPTLLIATGKGLVRAGIFSRQHLIVSGMECSTALPLIQEARLRELNLVLFDQNVHGDFLGMVSFEKSMAKLFRYLEKDVSPEHPQEEEQETTFSSRSQPFTNRDLYILSHSASGSQFIRYLLDKSVHYIPHIRAIAFTDSTHNVQWARQRGNDDLVALLESPACVYFRCANADRDSNWHLRHAGDEAPSDSFWKHRFGNIRTCWAGTKEHSLTNWFAHSHIWEHFDRFLLGDNQKGDIAQKLSHMEETKKTQ